MIPVMRDYQLDLIERVRGRIGAGARIIVVQAATGAGKTNIASYMAKCAVAKQRKSLFIVHRRRLVEQIDQRLTDFEVDHGVIMRGEEAYRGANVQVASRDTITSRCFTHEWTGLPPADIVFVDEAHHACDPESEHRKIIAQYPRATIILLTATPVGPDGKGMGPFAQAIECAAPTSQLVRDGYLCPVKCFAPDRKKGRAGKYRRGIAGDLVESWKLYGENQPTVLFTGRVQHSLDAVKAYQDAGIAAVHVDADTPDTVRDRAYDGLEDGSVKILANVGIVGEGVDVPCLGCVQFYMDINGRVAFLQRCGRIMRPSEGKKYGIVIDHAGAVFRHGFPDEDTEWTLEGNVDEDFKKKHDDGKTEAVLYCKKCELMYHGGPACPQCGRVPVKPPKSIFAPDPIDASNELLTEAERGAREVANEAEKIKHWMRCLGLAANKNGTFRQARVIYKQKYGDWPDGVFPCMPTTWEESGQKVADVYPNFQRKKHDRASTD